MLYKVSIKGPGVSIDQDITPNQAGKIIPIILTPSLVVSGNLELLEPTEPDNTSHLSIREYLNEKKPQTKPEKILVISKYLIEYAGYKVVSPEEIRIQFEKAYEPIPKNFSRDLRVALRSGWLTESSEEPGKFFVTNLGNQRLEKSSSASERVVNNIARRASRHNRKGGIKSTLAVSSEVQSLEVSDQDMESYVGISKKGDRVLWLLKYAKDNGIGLLNAKEIEILSSKLGGKILQRDIFAFTETHRKGHRILLFDAAENKAYKITSTGITFIDSI